MKIPIKLREQMVRFLSSIHEFSSVDGRYGLLQDLGLNESRSRFINPEGDSSTFSHILITHLVDYGRRDDGRFALEVFFEKISQIYPGNYECRFILEELIKLRNKSINLNIFISYAKEDINRILPLYEELISRDLNVWIDFKGIKGGQDWDYEIKNQISKSDIFIACLSNLSVNKKGYFQKELKKGLDICDEYPENKIYMIPIRLDDCSVPYRFQRFQWCNFFQIEDLQNTVEKIMGSIRNIEMYIQQNAYR